jgi:hypothetical protein
LLHENLDQIQTLFYVPCCFQYFATVDNRISFLGNKESADNIFKLFRESGLPPSESLLRTVLHQRSEAEFEFKVPARSKSHFQYLKHEQRNGTKNGSGSMPNVNIDSSLKKQTSSVNISSNSNSVDNVQNNNAINSNNSTPSLKPNTSTNTATSSTVIPK